MSSNRDSDSTPSWLKEENINAAATVASNPVAQSAAASMARNPAVQSAALDAAKVSIQYFSLKIFNRANVTLY